MHLVQVSDGFRVAGKPARPRMLRALDGFLWAVGGGFVAVRTHLQMSVFGCIPHRVGGPLHFELGSVVWGYD